MSLTELQEKRGQLVTQAREALDEIKSNTDEARAAELEERHDNIMADFDKVEKSIEREKKQAELEARLEQAESESRERNRPGQRDAKEQRDEQRNDDGNETEYRETFYKFIAQGGDLGSLDPEERNIMRNGLQKSAEFRAQTAGTNSAGGFTVPTELANQIIKSMAAWGPMYNEDVATVMTTASGNSITIPTVNDTTVTAVAHTEGSR